MWRRLAVWSLAFATPSASSSSLVAAPSRQLQTQDFTNAPFLQFKNGYNVTVMCGNFTGRLDKDEIFLPGCLPVEFQTYSFLAGKNYDKEPFIYNSWIFAEACGLQYMTYRYDHFHDRRYIIHEAVEAVMLNWFVYLTGILLATFVMNVFFIAPRGRRCCGIFEAHPDPEDPHPRFTYKTCLAPLYFFMFLIALLILVACMFQFIVEQVRFRNDIQDVTENYRVWMYNATGPSTIWFDVPSPDHTCAQSMFLNWPCNRNLLEICVLAMYTTMDLVFLAVILCTTCCSIALSCLRTCFCCICCRACGNSPLCCCSSNFNCGLCFSWCVCGPIALIVFLVFSVIIVGGYFVLGLLVSLFLLFLFLGILAAIVLALEFAIRKIIELASCGRCQILDVPASKYLHALFPLPQNALALPKPKTGNKKPADDDNDHDKDDADKRPSHPSEAGWEEEIMGVPHHCITFSFPILAFIAAAPIVVLIGISLLCFPWADRLAHMVAWKSHDMEWYIDSMDDVGQVWAWYWQIFCCLLGGVSDAFQDIFNDFWGIFRFDNDSTWAHISDTIEVGIQFWNLFNVNQFDDFLKAVYFNRFVLAFLFACCRITALINYSTDADIWEKRGEYPPEARPLSRGGQDGSQSARDTMYNDRYGDASTQAAASPAQTGIQSYFHTPAWAAGMHAPSWTETQQWAQQHHLYWGSSGASTAPGSPAGVTGTAASTPAQPLTAAAAPTNSPDAPTPGADGFY